jgi:hypothetical protein
VRQSYRPGVPEPPRLSRYLNPLIDNAIHPIADSGHPELYILDSMLHATVELSDQAVVSLWKSIYYNAPRALRAASRRR